MAEDGELRARKCSNVIYLRWFTLMAVHQRAVAVYTRGIEPGRLRPQQMTVVRVKCQEPEVWAQGSAYDLKKVSILRCLSPVLGDVIRFGLETPGSTPS